MSHHIYVTEGFVVASQPHGEAGKFLFIFTREIGMVGAVAQGLRYEKSKLRYYLQDYGYAQVSLVRGKDVWRLTGAKATEDECGYALGQVSSEGVTSKKFLCFARILTLLKRLLPGEEKNEELFDMLRAACSSLAGIPDELIPAFECVVVQGILYRLGYMRPHGETAEFCSIAETGWNHDMLGRAEAVRPHLLKEINAALKETQL